METSPVNINHQEKRRVVSVKAFVQQGFIVSRVIGDVITKMDAMQLPAGYSYEMGGEVESAKHSFGGFQSIILVTVFLFIAVLILEFKTFKSTLIILSVIPLGIVGAALALWMTGNTLSFVAIIGLIALAGIEVKNTILLVDFYEPAALTGPFARRCNTRSGGSPLPAHCAHLVNRHRRPHPHRGFEQPADLSPGHRAHRRADQLHAAVEAGDAGGIQTHSAESIKRHTMSC